MEDLWFPVHSGLLTPTDAEHGVGGAKMGGKAQDGLLMEPWA